MRYEITPNTLFKKNRQQFKDKLPKDSLAIFVSNDVLSSNGDGTVGFYQNSNLLYLTAIDQESSILIIKKGRNEAETQEILMISETNAHLKLWEGEKLTVKQAQKISGIEKVKFTKNLWPILDSIILPSTTIFFPSDAQVSKVLETANMRIEKQLKQKYPEHQFEKSESLLNILRVKKQPAEIELIKKACEITALGMKSAAKSIKNKVTEFEIEAEITYTFLKNKSRRHAFSPIIAGGKNACVLHYITNNATLKAGDMVLVDIGAEYANYNGDMSRTFPVSGKFTDRQKAVYNAVLNVFKFTKSQIFAGNNLVKLKEQCFKKMAEELYIIDLIQENYTETDVKKYFPHGVSHFLGLDVHDVGDKNTIFAPGMVLTCEPGIYIPEENIGIRIENDILVTETGNLDLMEDFPIEISEIENLMK